MMERWHQALEEFDCKGFVVIPKFFDDYAIELFTSDFQEAIQTPGESFPVVNVSRRLKPFILEKVHPVMAIMHMKTRLKTIDLLRGASYFSTGHGVHFPWHQDAKSYFLLQEAFNYLNLYIPVMKPVAEKSNLKIIPFDVLGGISDTLAQKLQGRGATAAFVQDGHTLFYDNINDEKLGKLDVNLDDLAITPALNAGDLLMMRGDILHCTQDNDTQRVALSIRLMHSQDHVVKQHIHECGWYKLRMMLKNSSLFLALMACFDECGREEISVGEVMDYLTQKGLDGFRD
ncbi:hypothetical protein [Legionella spiritensis]|uniref:hypothetical protein n=1 Tax=Legionella spiritensis TaxID=452 RepID=UPI000F6D0C35|nr:hypothetical protein [Legionella spiritensis]VEG89784.1 Uncharacterised protein [Legionella spiritensis]